ncbi:MAG: hypothetical protein Q4F24_14795 [Eubacteriales bacterium]|nr:hypothetical protein [Eubacteriales bacterium]
MYEYKVETYKVKVAANEMNKLASEGWTERTPGNHLAVIKAPDEIVKHMPFVCCMEIPVKGSFLAM